MRAGGARWDLLLVVAVLACVAPVPRAGAAGAAASPEAAGGTTAPGTSATAAATPPAAPVVGKPAPPFDLVDAAGTHYTLDGFRGKQGVVLAWFPKAFTPGCTAEIQSLRDSAPDLDAFDVTYVMVSLDPAERNREFAAAYESRFPVLSDPTGAAARAYGVVDAGRPVPWRYTFYIDREGVLRAADREVTPASAGADVVSTLERLDFPKR